MGVSMRFTILIAVPMFLLLAACASGPQQVDLVPYLEVRLPQSGQGRELVLDVTDRRERQSFGLLAGITGNPPIGPARDPAAVFRQALAERFTTAGLRVSPPRPGAPLSLTVDIVDIRYEALGTPVVNEVRTRAVVRAVAVNQGRSVTGEYQSNSARRVIGPPMAADNAYLLNEVTSRVLDRMLADPRLIAALGL